MTSPLKIIGYTALTAALVFVLVASVWYQFGKILAMAASLTIILYAIITYIKNYKSREANKS